MSLLSDLKSYGTKLNKERGVPQKYKAMARDGGLNGRYKRDSHGIKDKALNKIKK